MQKSRKLRLMQEKNPLLEIEPKIIEIIELSNRDVG